MVNRARALRRRQTPAESALWRLLRDRRLSGHKFRRQYPVGPYVLDFYCPEAHLAVELDGGGHADERQVERDDIREIQLKIHGVHLLRVWNTELMKDQEAVLTMLLTMLSHSGKSKTGKTTRP
jgi:very-short-patch-repair endonuclease